MHELDEFWSESVIEHAEDIAKILGIDIDHIYWSGFGSQGDGACFVGRWEYAEGSCNNVLEYAPKDNTLHRIADGLRLATFTAMIQPHNDGQILEATVEHVGHYYHSGSTSIVLDLCDSVPIENYWLPVELITDVKGLLRGFMGWIYKSLEAEYDYQMAQRGIDP